MEKLASLAGHYPGFIACGTSLKGCSITTDNASHFNNSGTADFPWYMTGNAGIFHKVKAVVGMSGICVVMRGVWLRLIEHSSKGHLSTLD